MSDCVYFVYKGINRVRFNKVISYCSAKVDRTIKHFLFTSIHREIYTVVISRRIDIRVTNRQNYFYLPSENGFTRKGKTLLRKGANSFL